MCEPFGSLICPCPSDPQICREEEKESPGGGGSARDRFPCVELKTGRARDLVAHAGCRVSTVVAVCPHAGQGV